eukprot:scaffold52476_cov37-Phaeocystis_antarctica.AAC.2
MRVGGRVRVEFRVRPTPTPETREPARAPSRSRRRRGSPVVEGGGRRLVGPHDLTEPEQG